MSDLCVLFAEMPLGDLAGSWVAHVSDAHNNGPYTQGDLTRALLVVAERLYLGGMQANKPKKKPRRKA